MPGPRAPPGPMAGARDVETVRAAPGRRVRLPRRADPRHDDRPVRGPPADSVATARGLEIGRLHLVKSVLGIPKAGVRRAGKVHPPILTTRGHDHPRMWCRARNRAWRRARRAPSATSTTASTASASHPTSASVTARCSSSKKWGSIRSSTGDPALLGVLDIYALRWNAWPATPPMTTPPLWRYSPHSCGVTLRSPHVHQPGEGS